MSLRKVIQKVLFLLCLMPCLAFGQSTVWGVILDSQSGEPLPYATVYINGSTKGTITDDDGHFELKNVEFPSTMVFSFVGYRAQVLELDHNPGALQIRLNTNNGLPEVVITDTGEREKYLGYFKRMFLGDDRWGQQAIIRNEDVILFHNIEADESENTFKAWAGEPIIIDLPLLGYELYVDLADFTVQRVNGKTFCDILGYFLYKPYAEVNEKQAARIQKNRQSAYYNSNLHFLRSFYQNRLAENGYVLSMADSGNAVIEGITEFFPVDISNYSERTDSNEMQIHGLSDKRLKIQYYHRLDGSPLDLTQNKPGIHMFSESGIHLLKDTCTILSNGIITDNSIRFTGDISEKRIGASLPEDYQKFVTSRSENEYPSR